MNGPGGTLEGPAIPEARIEDLAVVQEFVEEACRRANADDDVGFAVRLAVEEAFTNVVQHGYGDRPGPVRLGGSFDDERIAITLTDEAPHFDPEDIPAPDLDSPLEHRNAGGLGWHLICRMMDEVKHTRGIQRGNIVTLVKRLI